MRKTCKEAGVTDIPVNARFIWRFSLAILAVFFVVNYFYEILIIRYLILVAIIVTMLVQRKKIIDILKMIMEDKRA